MLFTIAIIQLVYSTPGNFYFHETLVDIESYVTIQWMHKYFHYVRIEGDFVLYNNDNERNLRNNNLLFTYTIFLIKYAHYYLA